MDECRAENCTSKHPHKRYCPQQHDTFLEGRGGTHCRECRREEQRKPVLLKRNRERKQRRYWSEHEFRFERRQQMRERKSPHIWAASKEVV